MDRLDDLEAQSIFILREAFARLKRIALLWSLGKDSNVMIWLARKAFFGRVPFPAMHVDTGRKFPEMYAFRNRYAEEWNLDLLIESLQRVTAARCAPARAPDPALDRSRHLGLHAAGGNSSDWSLSRPRGQALPLARGPRHHISGRVGSQHNRRGDRRARRDQCAGA